MKKEIFIVIIWPKGKPESSLVDSCWDSMSKAERQIKDMKSVALSSKIVCKSLNERGSIPSLIKHIKMLKS